MDFQQSSTQLLCVEEDMEVTFSRGPSSGPSSGFEGSVDLVGVTGAEPSPNLSIASSPFSDYHYIPITAYSHGTSYRADVNSAGITRTEVMMKEQSSLNNHAEEMMCSPCLSGRSGQHQSLPTEAISGLIGSRAVYVDLRHQSSAGYQRSLDPMPPVTHNTPVTNKLAFRGRGRANINVAAMADVHAHSVPGNAHPLSSSLEPIPQGQELSVNTTNLPNIGVAHSVHSPNGMPICAISRRGHEDTHSNRYAFNSVELAHRRRASPCCACRSEEQVDAANSTIAGAGEYKNGYTSRTHKSNHCSTEDSNVFDSTADRMTSGKHDPRGSHTSHWARDLIARFRSGATSISVDHTDGKVYNHEAKRHSIPQSNDSIKSAVGGPDTIDPRRLPKTCGPASACLEFSKKPLQSLPSSSTPIPVLTNKGACATMFSSSWKPRRHTTKVRWLSQSISEESAVEPTNSSFGRYQSVVHGGIAPLRSGVRVKRASESDRLLVISKSLSDSKEDFSCSFGQFDENHVYSTLFRHSTCYDVLPDSGKLVMLDSRLGIVRAINALLENGVQAAPIWNANTQCVIGLFSQDVALHMLTSLSHYSTGAANAGQTDGPVESGDHPTTIASGLRLWGSQHLCDVLRLFHTDPDKSRYSTWSLESTFLVSPQTQLKRALCRLLQLSHSSQRVSQFVSHSRASSEANEPHVCFSLDSSASSDSTDALRWSSRSTAPPIRQLSDPLCSGIHASHVTVSSASQSPHISGSIVPALTHLIVMNPTCGNVLGILNADRLLAYLRLRLDELPYSAQMLSPIGSIPSLLWADRYLTLSNTRIYAPHNRRLEMGPSHSIYPLIVPHCPILYPSTTCYQALCTLTAWLPQLPALPVICSNEGASTTTNTLVGLIAPGDLLHFFLEGCPDTAASQPLSKILNAKLSHCRFQQECYCHTQETLLTVLDRMFHLRTPCLVLFEASRVCAGVVCGQPIGMVTAKDVLCAVMCTKSHIAHRHRQNSGVVLPTSQQSPSDESPMEVFEDYLPIPPSDNLATKPIDSEHASDCILDTMNASSDDDSVSTGSTYSARSFGSDRMEVVTTMVTKATGPVRSRDHTCSCACHHSDKRPSAYCEAQGSAATELEYTKPLSATSRNSVSPASSTRPGRSSRNAVVSQQPDRSAHLTSKTLDTVAGSQTVHFTRSADCSTANRKKWTKRGDEDDVVFPMD